MPSKSVTQLSKDTASLSTTLDIYIKTTQKVDSTLLNVKGMLEVPQELSADLEQLISGIKTVRTLLTTASVVPQIRSKANAMLKSIGGLEKQIIDAKKKIDEFDKKIAPLREKIDKIEKRLKKAIDAAIIFKKRLQEFVAALQGADKCISSWPEGDFKKDLQADFDKTADASDKWIKGLDASLQAVIKKLNDIEGSLEKKIEPLLAPIDEIENQVADLRKKLQGIVKPLQAVINKLNQGFSFSFRYPNPTWKNPFRTSHYKVTISMRIIIQGANAIEREIERILSKTLWKILETLGVGQFVKQLQNQANKALSSVLSALHLDFNIQIPGLSKLAGALTNLSDALTALTAQLDLDLDPESEFLNQLANDKAACMKVWNNCKKRMG
jgi:predicted  nucleic acid-binding Zn-ribbon protein